MPRRPPIASFVTIAAQALICWSCGPASPVDQSNVRRDIQLLHEATTIAGVVPRNATLESVLGRELPPELARSVAQAVKGVFDPRRFRADQPYKITRGLNGLLREFRYDIDANTLLRVVLRTQPNRPTPAIDVALVPVPTDYAPATVVATISREHPSIVEAFDAAGENVQLPLRVADIFGGEVDFHSELNRGDAAKVLFDRASREGEPVGYGDVKAAVLTIGKRTLTAIHFVGPDGKPGFYDEHGRSLRRAFLKSPLPISARVTSGFSRNRFHPINRSARPHLGIDYGAPAGTPVNAVAAGIVEAAEWSGEAGRMVRIRHAGGYKTAYLHLSSFAPGIRAGVRVEQGAPIGRVGQSGNVTGPHLDYRVMKNGTYLNPATAFRNLPQGDPIPASGLGAFNSQRDKALRDLASRSAAAPASSR